MGAKTYQRFTTKKGYLKVILIWLGLYQDRASDVKGVSGPLGKLQKITRFGAVHTRDFATNIGSNIGVAADNMLRYQYWSLFAFQHKIWLATEIGQCKIKTLRNDFNLTHAATPSKICSDADFGTKVCAIAYLELNKGEHLISVSEQIICSDTNIGTNIGSILGPKSRVGTAP